MALMYSQRTTREYILADYSCSDCGFRYITAAEEGLSAIVQMAVPGKFLVDALPFLKYVPSFLPGAKFKRDAHNWSKVAQRMIDMPFTTVKQRIVDRISLKD